MYNGWVYRLFKRGVFLHCLKQSACVWQYLSQDSHQPLTTIGPVLALRAAFLISAFNKKKPEKNMQKSQPQPNPPPSHSPRHRRGGYKHALGTAAILDPILNPANRPNMETAEQTTKERNRDHPDPADAADEGWLEKYDEAAGSETAGGGCGECCCPPDI